MIGLYLLLLLGVWTALVAWVSVKITKRELVGKVTIASLFDLSAAAIANLAKSGGNDGLAYRYALLELNSFAVSDEMRRAA